MPAALGLQDSFAEEGLWWREGSEEDQVGGTLTFDPEEGPKLVLLGLLGDVETALRTAFSGDRDDRATIHGVTRKGRAVTLLNAMNVNRQFNMPGIATETWKSNLLVVGLHLSSADADEVFCKSYVRFEGIERWLGHEPFETAYDDVGKSLTVKASKPREVHFAHHDDFEVTSVGSLYSDNKEKTRFAIDVVGQLAITPPAPKSLNWHFVRAVRLQELASLCTGHHLPLTGLELRGPDEPLGGGGTRPAEIHVYAQMMHSEAGRRPAHEPPVLSGPELVALSPRAVQLWFDQHELFRPAINLFFTVTGHRLIFVNVRLILAIQALELFHRRTAEDRVMPTGEFPAFAARLVKSIPAEAGPRMREKLKGAYRYLNEPSLGQRLRSIVAGLTADFGKEPPGLGKAYLRRLVDTRNYFTHFSEELRDRALDGAGMHWASRRIVLLFTLLLLRRLGLEAGDIAPLLERHREFAHLWSSAEPPA